MAAKLYFALIHIVGVRQKKSVNKKIEPNMSLVIATANGLSSLDVATGNLLKSYKQCENVPYGLALLASSQNHPCSVLALQRDRPLIHHYQLKKEAVAKRIVLPGKMSAISASPNGQWLAAGSITGAIFVWNIQSGALKTLATDAHFQSVTCLKWSKDSSVLVSGGADARVLIWRTFDLVSMAAQQPLHVLTPHTLPIVACELGGGTFREARLYIASEDATVTVFDLFSGRLLYTIACDATKLYTLVLDPAERVVYLGGNDGVHCIPLYYESPNSAKLMAAGSSDGAVVSANTVGEQVLRTENNAEVMALAISNDAAHLFVGTSQGVVSSWETGSFQMVKKYRTTKGSISSIVFSPTDFSSDFTELPIMQRTIEGESLGFVPPETKLMSLNGSDLDFLDEEMDEIDQFSGEEVVVDQLPEGHKTESETTNDELEELRARHEQLQKMYDALWTRHMQK